MMRLLIDGDGCPDRDEIKKIAIKYNVEMIVFIDYAHVIEDDYFQVIECEVGRDSVDMELVHYASKNDLVITQDYGLASLVLSKGAFVLHTTGKNIHLGNIDRLLMTRYISRKQRGAGLRMKGPEKRNQKMREEFLRQLDNYLHDLTMEHS